MPDHHNKNDELAQLVTETFDAVEESLSDKNLKLAFQFARRAPMRAVVDVRLRLLTRQDGDVVPLGVPSASEPASQGPSCPPTVGDEAEGSDVPCAAPDASSGLVVSEADGAVEVVREFPAQELKDAGVVPSDLDRRVVRRCGTLEVECLDCGEWFTDVFSSARDWCLSQCQPNPEEKQK